MGRRACDRGAPAHTLGIMRRGRRREIGKERGGWKDGDAPEEAFARAIEGGIGVWGGGQVCAENLPESLLVKLSMRL